MDHEKVIVIDFGGQYNQLVARRVRTAAMKLIHRPVQKNYLNSACRF